MANILCKTKHLHDIYTAIARHGAYCSRGFQATRHASACNYYVEVSAFPEALYYGETYTSIASLRMAFCVCLYVYLCLCMCL